KNRNTRRHVLRHRTKPKQIMDAEKTSSKLSATFTNISIAVVAIGSILAGYYAIQDQMHERNMTTAREVMTDVMGEQDLLTATEFNAYVAKQESRSTTI